MCKTVGTLPVNRFVMKIVLFLPTVRACLLAVVLFVGRSVNLSSLLLNPRFAVTYPKLRFLLHVTRQFSRRLISFSLAFKCDFLHTDSDPCHWSGTALSTTRNKTSTVHEFTALVGYSLS